MTVYDSSSGGPFQLRKLVLRVNYDLPAQLFGLLDLFDRVDTLRFLFLELPSGGADAVTTLPEGQHNHLADRGTYITPCDTVSRLTISQKIDASVGATSRDLCALCGVAEESSLVSVEAIREEQEVLWRCAQTGDGGMRVLCGVLSPGLIVLLRRSQTRHLVDILTLSGRVTHAAQNLEVIHVTFCSAYDRHPNRPDLFPQRFNSNFDNLVVPREAASASAVTDSEKDTGLRIFPLHYQPNDHAFGIRLPLKFPLIKCVRIAGDIPTSSA
ncbi:hypothetical protein BXZ70DRAFT_905997 [Cristinia sonorae]|uniref:Uncharacterized protein n=1 Tax=Cristinia sonorae TaxID=1940300 RepID=A0A8K0XRN2_9AGAR|nr:hypothetical protein BXZ70DRAFT_905997 [Cristinia sonorae]